MDVGAYLDRIGYRGPMALNSNTLQGLHRAHMLHVPFENLDIPLGREIVVSVPPMYEKIVIHKRGGFCYELNGLFGWLLGQLGFDLILLSARVFDDDDEPGPEFDHMVLLVRLEDTWLADVGFGDLFLEPVRLDELDVQERQGSLYRFSHQGDDWILQRKEPEQDWESQYLFTQKPRSLEDFSEMCSHHQTSPDSSFMQRRTCSLATNTGRITLSGRRLIITDGGSREERELSSLEEYGHTLESYFGIHLESLEHFADLFGEGGSTI